MVTVAVFVSSQAERSSSSTLTSTEKKVHACCLQRSKWLRAVVDEEVQWEQPGLQ
jgi:hypothetical protein